MPRLVDDITINYRDEKGVPATLTCPASDGLDVGQVVNRITNGQVTKDSHTISKNGRPCAASDPIEDGDQLVGSPNKTGGGS